MNKVNFSRSWLCRERLTTLCSESFSALSSWPLFLWLSASPSATLSSTKQPLLMETTSMIDSLDRPTLKPTRHSSIPSRQRTSRTTSGMHPSSFSLRLHRLSLLLQRSHLSSTHGRSTRRSRQCSSDRSEMEGRWSTSVQAEIQCSSLLSRRRQPQSVDAH